MNPAGSSPDGADGRADNDPTVPAPADVTDAAVTDAAVTDAVVADAAVTDAERIRSAVLDCPDVVDLSVGAFGEVASYLAGRTVTGVRVDEHRVEVHIVAAYGRSLREVADEIGRTLAPLLAGRPLRVAVDDIVLPGETPRVVAGGDTGA